MNKPHSFAIGVEPGEAFPLFKCSKPSYTDKFSNFPIKHKVKVWQFSLTGVNRDAITNNEVVQLTLQGNYDW